MRQGQQPEARVGSVGKSLKRAGSDLDQKFWVALALYVVLAALAWFTVGEGTILLDGRPVELRLLPLVIIGGMALKTVLARQADKIRRDGR
jgi:hypothetical protein